MNYVSQSHNRKNSVLKDGTHLVTISEVSDDLAKATPHLWSDVTPQIRIKFKSPSGAFISQWVNLIGYHTSETLTEAPPHVTFKKHPISKEDFAVDTRVNKRIENPIKTETCHKIICRIASSGGLVDGTEFNLIDLLGIQLYITVKNNKVTHTHKIEEIKGVNKNTPIKSNQPL